MRFARVTPFLLVLILISGVNAKKLKKEVNDSLFFSLFDDRV